MAKSFGEQEPIDDGSRVEVMFDTSVKYHEKTKTDPSYVKWVIAGDKISIL